MQVISVIPLEKEGIFPVATLNVTQLTVLRQRCTFSEAEVYINVYKGDDNFSTAGPTLLSDLDLQKTYNAIDSVATGKIPSLSCGNTNEMQLRLRSTSLCSIFAI